MENFLRKGISVNATISTCQIILYSYWYMNNIDQKKLISPEKDILDIGFTEIISDKSRKNLDIFYYIYVFISLFCGPWSESMQQPTPPERSSRRLSFCAPNFRKPTHVWLYTSISKWYRHRTTRKRKWFDVGTLFGFLSYIVDMD